MAEDPYRTNIVPPRGLVWIKRVSYLMDEQFRFPGTKFRFGIDPIVNIFPVFGDLAGFIVSAGLLYAMAKRGASSKVVVLMSVNILLDSTIGAIPLVGQVFDFFFKSNTRNLTLMQEHFVEGKHQGSGKGTIAIVVIVLLIVLSLLVYGIIKLGEWVVTWF
jgi:hypothetical protein